MAKKKEILFCDYFEQWIETYKVGAITDVTLAKYYMAARHLRNICPKLFMSDFDRGEYQKIINEFAKTHEKQTTTDFHHSISARLGHSNVTTTQETYAHILDDLKAKDDQMMMSTLMSIA